MRREAEVSSWNPKKFCGVAIDRSVFPPERFFLFANRVVLGPEPYRGARIVFDADTRPPIPGKLTLALNVEVLMGAPQPVKKDEGKDGAL